MNRIEYMNLNDENISIDISASLTLTYNKAHSEMKLYNKAEEEDNILDSHSDKVVYVEKLTSNSFLSVSLDKTVKFWDMRGSLLSTFDLNSELLALEFVNDEILLISKNYTYLLSQKGQKIFSIEENIESILNIKIWTDSIHFLCNKNLIIYSIDSGDKIIKFENQDNFIESFKKLNNGNIITRTDKTSLWNSNGKLIKVLDINFDFNNIIQCTDNNLLILSDNKIYIFDKNGKEISSFRKDNLSDDMKIFIDSLNELETHKIKKNNINQFPHISNPFAKAKVAIDELNKQDLLDNKKFDKEIWNFFNRPLFSPIKKILKREENLSKKFIKKIDDTVLLKNKEQEELENELIKTLKNKKMTKWLMIIPIVVFIITIVLVYGLENTTTNIKIDESTIQNVFVSLGLELVAFIIFMIFTIKLNTSFINIKKDIEIIKSEIETLKFISLEVTNFIPELKKYRSSLIKQFPIVKDVTLFDGKKIEEKINKLLEEEINNVAMNECGIINDEIIHVDNKAIILNDWSLIQLDSNKINPHNMESYWGIDKKILFATQFIQYIFLTKDKIDVFNTHYDFIQNKFIRKEAHAFYYKDVTNITKKEIERKIYGGSESTPATEITLKVSSGDSINLTILNEDTLIKLNSEIHNDNNEEKLDDLEKQREEIKNDTNIDDEEREESLAFIDAQINTLNSNASISNTQIDEISKVDSTIQNIRSQIKVHKQ